ncbi:hypothetical protein ACFQ5D_24315, partial [Paenibacillus farraposensis]
AAGTGADQCDLHIMMPPSSSDVKFGGDVRHNADSHLWRQYSWKEGGLGSKETWGHYGDKQ